MAIDDLFFNDEPVRELSEIHIRLKQRNGKKCITFIEGFAPDLDVKKILRCMKRTFKTNGAILKDDNDKELIQLNGDKREVAKKFLYDYRVCETPDPEIIVHGF